MINWLKMRLKSLKKLFMPNAATLAELSAERIAQAVNTSKAETQVKIGRISAVANEAAALAAQLSAMLEDGTLSNEETAELAKLLTPLFERVVETI